MNIKKVTIVALTATILVSGTAHACPNTYYNKDTSFEKVLEAQKKAIENRGGIISDCAVIVKEAVDANTSAGISNGQYNVTIGGFSVTSIYACKSEDRTIYIRISRFTPTENRSYNGFNAVERDRECPAQTGAFVSATVSSR